MKIKIIDLLVKIANGEEVPKKIRWGVHIFEWCVCEYKATGELGKPTLSDLIGHTSWVLNNNVEIIEDVEQPHEDKKIEKLTFNDTDVCCVDGLMKQTLNIKNTINEIIDRLNEMDKGE